MSFQVKPTQFGDGYHDILHFTTGERCCDHGTRIPAVWFYGDCSERKSCPLLIKSSVNEDPSYFHLTSAVELNKWTSVVIQQSFKSGRHWYQILIDRNITHEVENTKPQIFHDVKVYLSNPWDEPQKGQIRALSYKTSQDSSFDRIGKISVPLHIANSMM